MRPIKTADTNLIYRGNGEEVEDLPVESVSEDPEHGVAGNWSVWEPTDYERECIADGFNIRLGVFTNPHPAVVVEVTNETEVAGE